MKVTINNEPVKQDPPSFKVGDVVKGKASGGLYLLVEREALNCDNFIYIPLDPHHSGSLKRVGRFTPVGFELFQGTVTLYN